MRLTQQRSSEDCFELSGVEFANNSGDRMNRDLVVSRDDRWDVLPHVDSTAARHPEEPPSAFDLSRLVRILVDWRTLILAAAAAGLLAGIALSMLTTPMYRADVVLEVNPPSGQVQVVDEQVQSGGGPSADMWQFVATQVGLLQSRGLAKRVVQDLGLAKNPEFADQSADPAERVDAAAEKIIKRVNIAPQSDGQLIRFAIVWDSPQMAAEIANAYAEAFIYTSLQRRYNASAHARQFLQRQIASTRSELQSSERQLVEYAQAQGIINTGSGEGQSITDASSPQGQSLIALNNALAEAIARRVAAEGAYRQAASASVTSDVTATTQPLRQLRADLQSQYQEKRAVMKPEHPELLRLRSRIDELNSQIARETATAGSSRTNSALAEYRAALGAERALQAKVAGLKSEVLNLRGRSIQYAILQRDVDTNRALYDALLQRYKEIGVAGGVAASPVSVVDQADVPDAPFKPNVLLNVLIGIGLGFLVGVLAAIGLDILNDTIRTPSDVRNKLRLACLAAIPKRPGNVKRTDMLEELDDPTSPAAESYATLATSLRFTTDEGLPHVLQVTSARAAEGKSTTALALAHHFAKAGKSVLLIAGDLRKPSFGGNSDQTGLTTLLTTEDSLEEHVTPTKYENLTLLQRGPEPPNPAALLASSRFQIIIAEATAKYDLVVVDAPPLLGLADAPLIASVVNVVVLVIESGRTRTSVATEAIHRLRAAGGNIVGVTLTKSAPRHSGYGYGYGRYGYGENRYGAVRKDRPEFVLLTDESQG